ncbi:MAG: ATP-dependent protease ATPase subunit HslU [Clostridia bacterium]|jgi:ATP-dependent HslUV protease ATP-binding subunit HslU|nr:ATP-dependent protease ATPase subunit HslU [Clostridia bacterium]
MSQLTPKEIVEKLDIYIIGQDEAKKAVAIALRNRYRRNMLDKEMQDEITPKNIIMVGPTGVGKTEIARRLSKLMQAPFIKVEATKFTEVGYVGRDVESMIRDLVEASIRMVKTSRQESVKEKAEKQAEERLVDVLAPMSRKEQTQQNPFQALLGQSAAAPPPESPEEKQRRMTKHEETLALLRAGRLEDTLIEVEVEDNSSIGIEIAGMGSDINLGSMFSGIMPQKTKKRRVSVSEARKIFTQEEADKLIDMDEVTSTAIERAEQDGIIFLDEIDKVAGKTMGQGPDISREGVQRDILPIVEGSTVVTKYGPVKTDYMLFIAAGAFHTAKVSDLIPELQGRFPIKVELKSLSAKDMELILVQPKNALIKQYQALLEADNVRLVFEDDAVEAIAKYAVLVNETSENIGARRLHTVIENLLEDISYNASGDHPLMDVKIDAAYVKEHLKGRLKDNDLGRFIL